MTDVLAYWRIKVRTRVDEMLLRHGKSDNYYNRHCMTQVLEQLLLEEQNNGLNRKHQLIAINQELSQLEKVQRAQQTGSNVIPFRRRRSA